jgi:hypothetical protein
MQEKVAAVGGVETAVRKIVDGRIPYVSTTEQLGLSCADNLKIGEQNCCYCRTVPMATTFARKPRDHRESKGFAAAAAELRTLGWDVVQTASLHFL